MVGLLRERGTPFALIGAAGMAAHGVSRSTLDLDLLVIDRECLRPAYWEPVRAAGVEVSLRPGDDDDPLAGVPVSDLFRSAERRCAYRWRPRRGADGLAAGRRAGFRPRPAQASQPRAPASVTARPPHSSHPSL